MVATDLPTQILVSSFLATHLPVKRLAPGGQVYESIFVRAYCSENIRSLPPNNRSPSES
jgi:hypothetical protein